jgi:monofunctional biosynthetic peptidoglycan transglycosylase
VRLWFWRVLRVLLWVFIAAHIYLIALHFLPVPGTFLMAQRAVQGETIKRDWTRLEDISPNVVSAVIAAEDARFCQHEGLDLDAIQSAIEDNAKGGRRRGGSTISQQTVKNVFLWNGGGFLRKGAEAWFTPVADFVWGKRRTMEIYLNVAEWGDGIFGVEAAAQERFGKSAAELTKWEAALLASVLPSPNKWRLDPPGEYVTSRARTLNARLRVVRIEGYANCVLGPAPKQKPKPKSIVTRAPKIEEPVDEPQEAPEAPEPETEPVPEIEVEDLEPAISEEEEIIAPESEDEDTPSVEIPEPESQTEPQ